MSKVLAFVDIQLKWCMSTVSCLIKYALANILSRTFFCQLAPMQIFMPTILKWYLLTVYRQNIIQMTLHHRTYVDKITIQNCYSVSD